jgi:hypothetical protein
MGDIMNEKLVKVAEALGIDTKGKSDDELMSLISNTWEKEKVSVEESKKHEFIDNAVKKFPAIKKQFEKPFSIWLKKVQNGKNPECLPVVGYNPLTSSVIVVKETKSADGSVSSKIYQIAENEVITSAEQLTKINEELKEERAATKKKNKKTK